MSDNLTTGTRPGLQDTANHLIGEIAKERKSG